MKKTNETAGGSVTKVGFGAKLKELLAFALNPSGVLKLEEKQKWYLYLIFPAFGWLLFFLQVGMDRSMGAGKVILLCLTGLVVGYIMVGVIGAIIHSILSVIGLDLRFDQVATLIALSHTYMVFSLVLGFIYNLFGNSSSAAFGISGLMCTLLPIYSGIRSLGKGRAFLPPLLATLAGVILLGSWQLILWIGG